MKQLRPLRSFAALTVAFALVFSACGDDDGDAADSSTGTASADNASADTTVVATDPPTTAPEEATGTSDAPATDPTTTTIGVTSNYLGSYSLMDEEFGTMVTVTVDDSTRTIETNALPDHETGEFPNAGNPNSITAQDLTWEFPVEAVFTGVATEVRNTGVAVNGIKLEPGTAERLTCASGEVYRIEALQDVYDLGLDVNNAHVQPTGEYHYHGISSMLVDAYDTDEDLVHVGFAADGHLMYYSKTGAYASGYALSSESRSGTECVASGPNGTTSDVDGTTPDGTYDTDWVWAAVNGDLDECNGTTIDGEYVYIVTDDYPFVSRCLMGEAAPESPGGPPPGG